MRQATVYVAEDEHFIEALVGLQENYLAGIFVSADVQGQVNWRPVSDVVHVSTRLL